MPEKRERESERERGRARESEGGRVRERSLGQNPPVDVHYSWAVMNRYTASQHQGITELQHYSITASQHHSITNQKPLDIPYDLWDQNIHTEYAYCTKHLTLKINNPPTYICREYPLFFRHRFQLCPIKVPRETRL